ncbi:hypothetical protein [Rossellomorea vietnamensis]|uniref:hypothetical protein n=1 Tax=Rossellomorea vietnamensis TaxID=218284 RepID=UPI0012E717BB|nr:hypothetical protein [Rossellomorea vietnamensis]
MLKSEVVGASVLGSPGTLCSIIISLFFGVRRWRFGGFVESLGRNCEGGFWRGVKVGSAADFGWFFSRRIIGGIQQLNSKRKSVAE